MGNCPDCKQAAHMYSRNLPFGYADWPSNRLESCPQFLAKTSRQRGELNECIKGCYKCTSWKRQGKVKLHYSHRRYCMRWNSPQALTWIRGRRVAFCHKITVKATILKLFTIRCKFMLFTTMLRACQTSISPCSSK